MSGETHPHPPQPAANPPLALAYDELPPGSDLRRQFCHDGSVTITAPAGEPSEAARRAAMQSTGVFAALFAAALVGGWAALFVMGQGRQRIDPSLLLLAVALFAIVCGGVFLLAWRAGLTTRLGLLTQVRRQTTLLHAGPNRLLVETSGPDGDQSLDVPAGMIRSICPTPEGLLGGVSREPIPCLKVTTSDGAVYRLLRGRHRGELKWVADTLRQAMGT